MSNLLSGFMKRAAENVRDAVASAGAATAKMLKWNELGGVDPRTPEDMAAAQAVNLITLPKDVEGANCSNCIHFRGLDKKMGSGFCTNPEVQQDTTAKMFCGRWDNVGAHKSWEAFDAAEVVPGDMMQAAEQGLGMQAEGIDPATGQPMVDPTTGQPVQPGQPSAANPAQAGEPAAGGAPAQEGGAEKKPAGEKKPAKKEEKKDEKGAGGHAITINVNGGKTEKKAGVARAVLEGLSGGALDAESLARRLGKGIRRTAAPVAAAAGGATAVAHHEKHKAHENEKVAGVAKHLYNHRRDVINAVGAGSAAVGAASALRSARAAERVSRVAQREQDMQEKQAVSAGWIGKHVAQGLKARGASHPALREMAGDAVRAAAKGDKGTAHHKIKVLDAISREKTAGSVTGVAKTMVRGIKQGIFGKE